MSVSNEVVAARLRRRIAVARGLCQLTQRQLADRTGIGRLTTIGEIERGTRQVSAVELYQIAAVLGVSVDMLLGDGPAELVVRHPLDQVRSPRRRRG